MSLVSIFSPSSQNHTPTPLVPTVALPPPLPPPVPPALLPPTFRFPPVQVLPDDLPTHVHKHLVHVQPAPRAGLVIRDVAPHLRDLEGLGARDAAVVFEVGLVADEHDGDGRVVILHVRDLLAQLAELRERGGGCDAEDEEEALGVAHVHFSVRVVELAIAGLGRGEVFGYVPY